MHRAEWSVLPDVTTETEQYPKQRWYA